MDKRIIITEMVNGYIECLKEEERSKNTMEKYRRDIVKFMAYSDGREVTKDLTVAYKEHIKERYEPTSVNSMLAAVNSFFSFMGWNDCRVKRLRIQRKVFCNESRELSKAEYERLLKASSSAGQERINLIVQTICGTGIRVSELPFITVEAVGRGRAVVDCKGKVRLVFIPGKLQKLLVRYIHRQGIKSGSVFVTRTGKSVSRSSIWKDMKALCQAADVSPEKVFPHNLRHLFARTFYGIDKDISKLADVLGHTSIETTRGYILTSGAEHFRQMDRLGLV